MGNVLTVNVTKHLFCLYMWKLPQEEVCHVKIPTDLLSIKTIRAEYQMISNTHSIFRKCSIIWNKKIAKQAIL